MSHCIQFGTTEIIVEFIAFIHSYCTSSKGHLSNMKNAKNVINVKLMLPKHWNVNSALKMFAWFNCTVFLFLFFCLLYSRVHFAIINLRLSVRRICRCTTNGTKNANNMHTQDHVLTWTDKTIEIWPMRVTGLI